MAAWTQHPTTGFDSLTERQREVLSHIASGKTNPEIATLLGVSLAGAKWHVREVITKLGVENREDAAEIWRDEHALPRRFTNGLRAVVGFESLKLAGGAVAVGGIVLGAIGAVAAFRWSTPTTEETAAAPAVTTLPEFPNAIYTRQQATDVARDLAMTEIGRNPVLAAATFKGRHFSPSDLGLSAQRFLEHATWAETGLPGNAADFPAGSDLWLVEFRAFGWDTAFGPDELVITVAFRDGESELIEGWTNNPNVPLPIPDDLAHPARPTEVLAEEVVAGRAFRILAGTDGRVWGLAFGVQEPVRRETSVGVGQRGLPGSATEHLFGVTSTGLGPQTVVFGAAGPEVAAVELETSAGSRIVVEPQEAPPASGFPYGVFVITFPGEHSVVSIRASGVDGERLADVSCSVPAATLLASSEDGETWRCN